MNVVGLLVALLIGAICGWLAGQVVKGHGFGVVGNIIVGIVGALLFGFLFGNFSLFGEGSIANEIAGGTIGAILLLIIIGFFKKAT